jgi:glycosyltransferase involved in cell wall biosynthesis
MEKKIKVFFFLPNLMAGGAERVMSFVAQNIDKEKFDATLFVIGNEKDSAFKTTNVKTVFFGKDRVLTAILEIFNAIRKGKPNVVMSAIGHLNIIMAFLSLFFPKTKFIGREVNVISILKDYSDSKKKSEYTFLSKLAYRLLDKVICQSKDMASDLIANFGVGKNKIVVINNPITNNFKVKHKSTDKNNTLQLITVGRLAKQKGHSRILKSLTELKVHFHYTIIGDGPEKESIFALIDNYGLQEKVTHIPFTTDVPEFLANSDVFLQGSYVEGFPNALIESCAVGTPVIAYKAKGGIEEIIEENVNGYIAADDKDFQNKLESALRSVDSWSPDVISKTVTKKYSAEIIIKKYEDLLTIV